MIADDLKNLQIYLGVHGQVGKALEHLRDTNFHESANGRIDFDGANLYAVVDSYTTVPAEQKRFEAHRSYIDVQNVLEGEESIVWAPLDCLSSVGEYDEQKDVYFLEPMEQRISGAALALREGQFAVFFPHDAHKPGCWIDRPRPVRKVVMKVRVRR